MTEMGKQIIAIDGYSSCGKSTFAKAIAKELEYLYIDSGAMYRAVTLFGIRNNIVDREKIQTEKLVETLDSIEIDCYRKNDDLHVKELIQRLKNDSRVVLSLYYFEQLSITEISISREIKRLELRIAELDEKVKNK